MTNADQGRDGAQPDPPATPGESRRVVLPIRDWRLPAEGSGLPERRKVVWHSPDGEPRDMPQPSQFTLPAHESLGRPDPDLPDQVPAPLNSAAPDESPAARLPSVAPEPPAQDGPGGEDAPAPVWPAFDFETEEIPAISLAAFAEAAAIASEPSTEVAVLDEPNDGVFPLASSQGTHGRVRFSKTRRALFIGLAVVLVAVGGLAAKLTFPSESSSASTPTQTVVMPSPTPTVRPVPREDGTTFFAAIPSEVNDFALSGYTKVDPALDPELGSPIEAYTLTYTNGEQLILLYAAQWETEAEQQEALPTLAGLLSTPSDLESMPTWIREFATAQTAKSAYWGNMTAAFSATGPENDVRRFMQAFPM